MIHTKLHNLMACSMFKQDVNKGYKGFSIDFNGETGQTAKEYGPLRRMLEVPLYVIDREIQKLVAQESAMQTLDVLIENDLMRLPHPEMVIEYEGSNEYRDFVFLRQVNGKLSANCAFMQIDTGKSVYIDHDVDIQFFKDSTRQVAVTSYVDEPGMRKLVQMAVVLATVVSIVVLTAKGIHREVVETEKLNRARAKKGKGSIPSHTMVRVGKVYSSSGKASIRFSGDKMPMHLRAGHFRRQRHGPALSQEKMIYIEPCIVNYDPALGEIKHKPHVVTK